MKKILMISSLLLINNASAQTCIPKPDCADMGYTDTSCEGTSIKCPFDTSKMICLSKLIKKVSQNCTVGMVYYSDGSCLSSVDTTKTAIGVVVKNNELVLSQRSSSTMGWGTYAKELSLGDLTQDQAKNDFSGKSNTATIIAEDTGAKAAKYCNNYTTAGTSAGDWYLPAAGELYSYVYSNYNVINTTMTSLGWTLGSDWYWSSSERYSCEAWVVAASNGNMGNHYKHDNRYVSCLLEI